MQIKIRRGTLAIWLAVSCIAVLACVLNMSAARIGNEYLPMGNDSFYHAVRILMAASNPASFFEFDPMIHAPEGSLLAWPWGYDYVMAKLVRLGVAAGLSTNPLHVLLWIPVVAVLAATGLLMTLARNLSLTNWPTALAALCMALSPTTQLLFGFAEIDHHYAEFLFVLASLAAGLAWFRTGTVTSSIVLGALFGCSLAVHNGLFILQVPFLATLLARWLQGENPPAKAIVAFVLALLGSAIAVLVPSLPFQLGRFEFYTLSWFHLYVVCCTALVALLLTRLQPTRRNILMLAAAAVVLLVPLLNDILLAQSFLDGSLGMLEIIQEMQSPVKLALNGRAATVTNFYSLLIWLGPFTVVMCAIQCWRERRHPRLIFWIASTGGLLLLSTQLRMHYFGDVALYLPWLVLAQDFASKRTDLHKRIFLISSLLLLLAYIPQIRHALVAPIPRAGDVWFERLHPIFPALRKACAEDPGAVLADSTAGHYIRYYTQCSVVANNFLLTEQHFRKANEVMRLFSLPASELTKQAPYVKYVLVRPGGITPLPDGQFTYAFFGTQTPVLAQTLLLGPPQDVPPQFKLLDQVRFELRFDQVQTITYARLYKVVPDARVLSQHPSVNDVSK